VDKVDPKPSHVNQRCGLSLARLWPCHREHIRARLRLAKVSPCFHEAAPLFQGIAAPVSPLRRIASDMGKRRLGKLTREGGCFAAPIPERASEPMHRHVNIYPAKHRNFSTNSASLAQGVSTRTLRVSLSAVKSLSPKLGVDGGLGGLVTCEGLRDWCFACTATEQNP
jgi:hypothetical protein